MTYYKKNTTVRVRYAEGDRTFDWTAKVLGHNVSIAGRDRPYYWVTGCDRPLPHTALQECGNASI